ncbi:hypothetical protein PHMEG_00027117 [Phytophthora megakarya]|uniref:Bzip transcription factor n=1 Tax=Phytophthora megakarya TaxID=4795 RepID=A0A225V858_9STRA|nr:hypothetical protein PHMEG_00027117 [Phytophthora megakarya]
MQSSRRVSANAHDGRTTSLLSTRGSSKKKSHERKQGNVTGSRWHQETFAEIAELIHLGDKIKQEQRRKVQHRYRNKQINLKLTLENETRNLRNETQALQEQVLNKAIEIAVQPLKDVGSVAVRYFNIFQRCLRLQSRSNISAAQFDSLLNFVRATTAPDMLSSAGYGPEALIKSLSVLQKFDDVNMVLEEIDKVSANVVVATTKTSVTITEQTLMEVFPQLLSASANGILTYSLVEKLCGQQIILVGSTRFVWDPESDRVASIIFESDMLTPMIDLLGNLEDVSRVFEHALLTPISTG